LTDRPQRQNCSTRLFPYYLRGRLKAIDVRAVQRLKHVSKESALTQMPAWTIKIASSVSFAISFVEGLGIFD